MKMKLSPAALIALSILSLSLIGQTTVVITNLYFVDNPSFFSLQTCPNGDLRTGVLWSNVIANLLVLASGYLLYRLFLRIVVRAVWERKDSLRLTGLFFAASIGFFIAKLAKFIAKDFLMRPSEAGCPLFSSAVTSSYYLKAAIANLLFDPLFMMVVLLMALISAFLRYSYGLKEENDSFI